MYLLLRIFRKFNLKENENPENINVKNAIVYTGAFHSKIYMEFIKKYFNVMPTLSLNADKTTLNAISCISLPSKYTFFD